MVRLRAALQDDAVPALEAEGEGLDGHVGAGFVDHEDHADGDPHPADPESVRSLPHPDDLAHGVGKGRHVREARRHLIDDLSVDPEPVNHGRIEPRLFGFPHILHIFPENIAKSIAGAEILQIVVFSILFGIAMVMVAEKYRRPLLTFAHSLSEVMFKFTKIIMYFAPVAVFASIAFTVGHMGIGVVLSLLQLLGTLYVALLVFVFLVLFPVCLVFRIPVRGFIRAISEPAALAFATTSSEAALPLAMKKMEEFGVPQKIVSFVLPLGYTFNLDGTTLYLSLASVFVAQASGIDMPLGAQLIMMLTLMLTSKGVAGVSRAALVILLGTVASFGLSTLPVFLLLGVDALMDMARTATNVIGNSLASAVIARWENEFDTEKAKNIGRLKEV